MKYNYHTHTYLCGHASGKPEDYVKEAIKHNMTLIGISDHAPFKPLYRSNVRMKDEELPLYIQLIEEAQAKYGNQIKILKGLEMEYFYEYEDYIKELKTKIDYIIFGSHNPILNNKFFNSFEISTKEQVIAYAQNVVDAINSGLFDIIAHPDLYMFNYNNWDETAIQAANMIINAAKKTDSILELNANGLRRGQIKTPQGLKHRYPREEFWELVAKTNIKVIIGSDAHKPSFTHDKYVLEAEAFGKKYNLNIISHL